MSALATRLRLADPKPAYCAACFRAGEEGVRFVDFDAAIDRGQVIEENDGVVVRRESLDDIIICEACVQSAAEILGLDPELHARQEQQFRQALDEVHHWRSYALQLEGALKGRPTRKRGD